MNILVKQSLTFADYGGVLTGSGATVTVANSPSPQIVPDWVRNTHTWEQAAKSGMVLELPTVPAAFQSEATAPKPPAMDVQPMVAAMKPEEPEAEDPEPARPMKGKKK